MIMIMLMADYNEKSRYRQDVCLFLQAMASRYVIVGSLLRTLDNLSYPCEVNPDYSPNLAIAHALITHRENISAKLGFIRITDIAFG